MCESPVVGELPAQGAECLNVLGRVVAGNGQELAHQGLGHNHGSLALAAEQGRLGRPGPI